MVDEKVSYGFWHDPVKFMHILFATRAVYSADPKYSRAVADGNAFACPAAYAHSDSPEVLLEFATARFNDTWTAYSALQAKLEHILNLAIGVASGLAGLSGAMRVLAWQQIPGAAALFFALLVLFLSRRSIEIPNCPTIHTIRTNIVSVRQPHDWLANVLHQADRGLQVAIDIRAAQLDAALGSLIVGSIYLVAVTTYLGRGL